MDFSSGSPLLLWFTGNLPGEPILSSVRIWKSIRFHRSSRKISPLSIWSSIPMRVSTAKRANRSICTLSGCTSHTSVPEAVILRFAGRYSCTTSSRTRTWLSPISEMPSVNPFEGSSMRSPGTICRATNSPSIRQSRSSFSREKRTIAPSSSSSSIASTIWRPSTVSRPKNRTDSEQRNGISTPRFSLPWKIRYPSAIGQYIRKNSKSCVYSSSRSYETALSTSSHPHYPDRLSRCRLCNGPARYLHGCADRYTAKSVGYG